MSTPEFLGPYRIGESLGKGGMGSVFVGVHEKSKERVAVKLISEHVSDESRFRRRFDAEIETLKRLRHVGIVRIIGYGEEAGQLFYSMELVEGEPLQKRIRREKRLEWTETIEFSIQICAALKHAHDLGVIHRDLKPANLIITNDDKVKLVDFGIAKLFGYGEQTAAGSILGTADYMAPEQANNDPTTTRTDLYALGSVMYAMLAGRPPFKGKRITQVIEALRRDEPAPLELVNPDLPPELVELVHELLKKSPDDRPPTALVTMNRLKAMQAGLLREQTLHQERDATAQHGLATQHEIEADHKPAQTNVTGRTPPSGSSAVSAEDNKKVDASAGTVHVAGRNPHDATVAAENVETFDSSIGAGESRARDRSTHFQTVEEEAGESGIFSTQNQDQPSGLVHGLSIGLMLSVLFLAIAYIFFGFRKPTPEELYSEIVTIVSSNSLMDASDEIDSFMKLYPDHERFAEVKDMDMSIRRKGIENRLNRKKDLDPHEEMYLDAINLSSTDATEARRQYKKWSTAFGPDSPSAVLVTDDDERAIIKEMSEVADYEILRLSDPNVTVNAPERIQELQNRIRIADQLPADQRREQLELIVESYKDRPWAADELKSVTQKLKQLDQEKE